MDYGKNKKDLGEFLTDMKTHPVKTILFSLLFLGISALAMVVFVAADTAVGIKVNQYLKLENKTEPTKDSQSASSVVIYTEPNNMLHTQLKAETFSYEQLFNSPTTSLEHLPLKSIPVPNSIELTWGTVRLPSDSFIITKNVLTIYRNKLPSDPSGNPYNQDDLHITYRTVIE